MWHSSRLLRCEHLIRGSSIIARGRILELPARATIVPNLMPNLTPLQTQAKILLTTQPRPPTDDRKDRKEVEDKVEYTVKFKNMEVKKIFKEFYSLYGPLFVVCHITIALCSLGFFSALIWFTINPIDYLPDSIVSMIGEKMINMTGGGGKFAIAYAIHKVILPFRLGGAIWVTRFLAKRFKLKRTQDPPTSSSSS